MPDEPTTEAVEQPAEPTTPAVDLSPVTEQLERFEGRFGAIEQALAGQQPEETPDDPYAGLEDYAGLLGLEEPQPAQDPQQALRALADIGDQRAMRALEQNVTPQLAQMQQELQQFRVERDLNDLKQKYPDLQKPEVAEGVAGIVEQALVGLPPEARFNKHIVELAYAKYMSDRMAADEGSTAREHPQLESPGGAGPEGTEPDWNQRVAGGGAGLDKAASFWGTNGI